MLMAGKEKLTKQIFYFAKGICEKIMALLGIKITAFTIEADNKLDNCVQAKVKNETIAVIGTVNKNTLGRFDIKQPVLYVDIDWDKAVALSKTYKISYTEIPKFPAVQRDLAIVVDKTLKYEQVEKVTLSARLNKLTSIKLFDVFESEKLGAGKKSMAVSFTFLDEEKTMTDKDIDGMMSRIISCYEKELNAEIRK